MALNPDKELVVIGDIHGCSQTLKALYEKLITDYEAQNRTWVFVGDYIDRGPDSKGVIDLVLQISDVVDCVFLRGNHEQMLLDVQDGTNAILWMKNGAVQTMKSYKSKVPKIDFTSPHYHFYRNTELVQTWRDYVIVHGGMLSFVPIEDQIENEFGHSSFLWEREHIHATEFAWDKKVVFGHTPVQNPIHDEHRIGIDTGCVYKHLPGLGRLCAVLLPEEKFIFQKCIDSPDYY